MRRPRPPELALAAVGLALLGATTVGALRDEPDDPSAPAAGTVAIVDFDYDPTPFQASVGDPVTWTNQDEAPHTVTSDGEGPLASGELAQGASYEATFDAPGTYEYLCTIHPTMRGTVEVTS